ncbi:hypothetical protein AGMMS49592_6110 [Endomicrobiia bacterium]|nr:hypothetical protein AGMMS49592_6110 [Endomicrobiia bacterium]
MWALTDSNVGFDRQYTSFDYYALYFILINKQTIILWIYYVSFRCALVYVIIAKLLYISLCSISNHRNLYIKYFVLNLYY